MKYNVALFVFGLVVMLTGLYRIVPINNKRALIALLIQAVPIALALIIVLAATWHSCGWKGLVEGTDKTFNVSAAFFPTIAFLFPVMAFGGVLAHHFQANIDQMLVGKYGHIGTLGAAFLVPTANSVAEPIKTCWLNPAFRPLILYFLTAAALVCWPIFFFRSLGLNWEIGAKMYQVNWIVSIGILPGFWLWERAITHGGWCKALLSVFTFR